MFVLSFFMICKSGVTSAMNRALEYLSLSLPLHSCLGFLWNSGTEGSCKSRHKAATKDVVMNTAVGPELYWWQRGLDHGP